LTQMDPLTQYRKEIDRIDAQFLKLLSERGQIALEVGKAKRAQKADLYDPSREQRIYERLEKLNAGPFDTQSISLIFREIISASHALQEPINVAYLGPKATFTHLACLGHFGASVTDRAVSSIKEVFAEVEKGLSDFGVVPIENSTEGVVTRTLDLFSESPLNIFGEIILDITHHLLSKAKTLADVKQVYSHSQAIAQCKHFLDENLPDVILSSVSSTAKAAELSQSDPSSAAIASEAAGRIYNIPTLQKRIEDSIENSTRFLIISKKKNKASGADKTSIIVSIQDSPGELYKILRHFSKQQINLSKIGSRPSKKKAWEYLFHIDMLGHIDDVAIQKALEDLSSQRGSIKVLGSYPVAKEHQVQ